MDKKEFEERFGTFENNSELYLDLVSLTENQTLGAVIHVAMYMLAEIAYETGIPKREFVAFVVEQFDNAYTFLSLEKGTEQ